MLPLVVLFGLLPAAAYWNGSGQASAASAWSDTPDGFASVAALGLEGTTGGAGGQTVTVTTFEELRTYAEADEPVVIQVDGSIVVEPKGTMIRVASNKTIIGLGDQAAIVQGGFFLNGTHNIIIRNLTFRDSYVPGDWNGKENDNDGIRMDGAHHVWIDHNRFERLGDGMIDSRKDTSYVTISWNVFADHTKVMGIGWTDNVTAKLTLHHNWFRNTHERNPSADNLSHAHFYNNYMQNISGYGTWARGKTKMVLENSYFDSVTDPYLHSPEAELVSRGNVVTNSRGLREAQGEAFAPQEFYDYKLDSANEVPTIVSNGAGPQAEIGGGEPTAPPEVGDTMVVALDGSGNFSSIQHAIGAVPSHSPTPVTILVKSGLYRELLNVWPDKPTVIIKGASGNPEDVVITYDNAAGTSTPYGTTLGTSRSATANIYANDFRAEGVTFANDFDEKKHADQPGHQAVAVRTVGDRAVFEETRFIGNQDTLLLDTPSKDKISRSYLRNCYVEGDVDFIFGRGTAVFDHCQIHALARDGATPGGYVTAASTSLSNPYGFLFTHSRFTSNALTGSYYLGRPWHPSGDPEAVAQVLIRNSWLDDHIRDAPWTDMSGWPWQEARFAEYNNRGPGAGNGPDRPQMEPREASQFTPRHYLAGDDGWAPYRK